MIERREPEGEPLRVRWHFDAGNPASATAARASFLAFLKRRAGRDADLDGCAIIFGELVSNAIKHAPRDVVLIELELTGSDAYLRVRDRGQGFTLVPSLPEHDQEGGRGLYLVSRMAHRLEVATDGRFCTVTAALPLSSSLSA